MTDNEQELLNEIADHEFADALAGEGIPVSELCGFSGQTLGGVLSSLIRRGLVEWNGGFVMKTTIENVTTAQILELRATASPELVKLCNLALAPKHGDTIKQRGCEGKLETVRATAHRIGWTYTMRWDGYSMLHRYWAEVVPTEAARACVEAMQP